jgi:hypothetical protein
MVLVRLGGLAGARSGADTRAQRSLDSPQCLLSGQPSCSGHSIITTNAFNNSSALLM